jgi:hypothetical protein
VTGRTEGGSRCVPLYTLFFLFISLTDNLEPAISLPSVARNASGGVLSAHHCNSLSLETQAGGSSACDFPPALLETRIHNLCLPPPLPLLETQGVFQVIHILSLSATTLHCSKWGLPSLMSPTTSLPPPTRATTTSKTSATARFRGFHTFCPLLPPTAILEDRDARWICMVWASSTFAFFCFVSISLITT